MPAVALSTSSVVQAVCRSASPRPSANHSDQKPPYLLSRTFLRYWVLPNTWKSPGQQKPWDTASLSESCALRIMVLLKCAGERSLSDAEIAIRPLSFLPPEHTDHRKSQKEFSTSTARCYGELCAMPSVIFRHPKGSRSETFLPRSICILVGHRRR